MKLLRSEGLNFRTHELNAISTRLILRIENRVSPQLKDHIYNPGFQFLHAFSWLRCTIIVQSSDWTSLSAILLTLSIPHFRHLWTICQPLLPLNFRPVAFIMPWQWLFLSPGVRSSTCSDDRQEGQWLRYPPFRNGITCCRHTSHTKCMFCSFLPIPYLLEFVLKTSRK